MKNKLLQKNSGFVIEAQRSKYDKVRKAVSTYPSALNGLAAEARKCSTFEEFRKDFSIEIKHGTYWHLTTDPNFTIDSTKGPRDMSSMGGGGMSTGKLMITSHLENWDGYYNWEDDETEKVSRPYAALIDMSAVPRNSYRQVSRGFGNEFWVSDPSQAKVVSVMPIAKARAFNERQRQILGKYINSNENLEKFYNWAKEETGNEAEEQGKTAKADDASMTLIQSLVTEMMTTLAAGLPRPEIKIINRVGNYLGQCRWKYGTGPSKGDWCDENTVIELQKRILGDERTLRRVLFHEGCHHEDFLLNSTKQFKEDGFRTYEMRQKIRRDDGHGAGFMAVAARFNAKYGKDFVTKTSDADMVIDENTKEFFILIKMEGSKLVYAVSYRISPEQRGFIDYVKAKSPAKLCKSNLDMFSTGGKIGSSWSYPRDAEREQRLQEIWQSSPSVDLPEAKAPDPNREFYVALRLAAVHNTHHMGYFAYSINLSPKQKQQLQTIRDPWKVVKTNDKSFQTKKIGQGWDSAFLRWGDMMDRWQKLWDTAPVVMSGNLGKTATTDIPPENIQVITKSASFDDRERDLKFNELANAQRGEPEEAMLKCQMHPLGAGIGTNALEHIGDLTHRMAENFSRFQGQYSIVKDKVEKVLRWLTNSYDFYREVQGNIKNNYEFQKDGKLKGVSFEDAKVDLFKRWDAYAAAHGKLTVYNDAQRWARDAAIALGRRDFSKAALYLGFLKDVLDKGNEAYIQAAGEYTPGKTAVQQEKTASVNNSAAFKAWFAGSKVVDSNGAPLVVYHGTRSNFDEFDSNKATEHGFFFSESPIRASEFTGLWAHGANVMAVYLRILNPLRINGRNIKEEHYPQDIDRLVDRAVKAGKDGIFIKNFRDWGGTVANTWIAFEPNQIKSAIGNIGDYDLNNLKITADKTASNHKLYDHGNLPSFYDLFESGNPGCSYGIYDLLGGDEDWEPYVKKAMLLAAKKKVNLGEMEDEDRDQWVYDNVARADLEAKFNVVRERFAKMQFPLTAYRALDLKKLSDLRTDIVPGKNKLVSGSHEAFGHSWAWDEKGANNYGSDWQGSNDHTYIFRGLIASPKDVDWETTLQVNFLMPEEHEIRVLDGSSIQITGYKQHGGQWLEPEEQFKTVIASTSITATQQPPEGLKLVSYWDWSESGDQNLIDNAFIVYATLNGVMVGDVEFITTKNGQLLPNKVYVEPEFRRKGIASAMYVFAEKETGMKIRRHPLQEPDGANLWDKNPDRKFGDDLLGEEKEKTATTASKKLNQKLPSRGEAISLMKELSQLGDMPFNFIAYESINPFPISLYYTDEQIQSLVDTYGELKEVDPTTLVSCQMQLDPDVLLYFLEEPSRINTAKNKVWWDEYPVVFHYKGALILYEGNHRANAALILGIPLKVKWVEADNIPLKDKTASDKTPPFSDTRYPNMDSKIFKWESKFLASHKTPAMSDTVFPDVGNDRDSIGEGTNAYANLPEKVDNYLTAPSLKSIS